MAGRGARGSDDVRRIRDVVRPTSITMLRPSTLHKSPWTSKVSSFLYLSSIPPLLDGILRHAPSFDDARFVMTGACTREDDQGAQGMRADKTVAWKRRRKKSQQFQERYYRRTQLYYRQAPDDPG